jgi:membrane-associated protease RseP (regulator of RpoE activity)
VNRTERTYITTLAVIAAGILVVGYWLRPSQPANDDPVRAPSQTELSRLARITQRRSLDDMTEYFATVAGNVQSAVVALPGLERSGLVWEPGVILTVRTESRFPLATILATPEGDVGVAGVVVGPHIPIATVRMSDIQGFATPRRRSATTVETGAWTLAVWRQARTTKFVPAHFLGTAQIRCGERLVEELLANVAWTRDMAGGGLFDLDGSLLAAIVPCGDRFVAIGTGSVETMLRDGRSVEGRVLGRYGIGFEFLNEAEQEHFGRGPGVIVREVWTGTLADEAGLRPGDILLAINAEPIGTLDQLRPLGNAIDLEKLDVAVARAETVVTVVLPTQRTIRDETYGHATLSGIVWERPAVGYRINAVVADGPADMAGIRSGDRLVRIDGQELSDFTQVLDVWSPERENAVFLEVDRTGRRWGVLLP